MYFTSWICPTALEEKVVCSWMDDITLHLCSERFTTHPVRTTDVLIEAFVSINDWYNAILYSVREKPSPCCFLVCGTVGMCFYDCVCVHKDAVNKGSHLGELAAWPGLWQPLESIATKPARLLFLFPTSTSSGDPLVRHIGIELLAWSLITATSAEQRGQWERLMALSPTLHCTILVLFLGNLYNSKGNLLHETLGRNEATHSGTYQWSYCRWRRYVAWRVWVQIPCLN